MLRQKMADVDEKRQKASNSRQSDITREKWIHIYSLKLLKLWLQQQTPFEIACNYTAQIKEDLADFYEHPLKRRFIEATYN
jgi:hypothetical protein